MLRNLKIVCYLVLGISIIYCGIMRVNFIMEDGRLMLMEKDRNMDMGYNMYKENINLKVFLMRENELAMVP